MGSKKLSPKYDCPLSWKSDIHHRKTSTTLVGFVKPDKRRLYQDDSLPPFDFIIWDIRWPGGLAYKGTEIKAIANNTGEEFVYDSDDFHWHTLNDYAREQVMKSQYGSQDFDYQAATDLPSTLDYKTYYD